MPDKEIMLQIRQREEQRAWLVLDVLTQNLALGEPDAAPLRDALTALAEDWRATADLYSAAKLKGAASAYVLPLRHAAGQLDYVVKALEQPRRAPLGQLQPTALDKLLPTERFEEIGGLDEPVHRFVPGASNRTCVAMVERNGAGEDCGRFASHPAHRLNGPTELPGLDALISDRLAEQTTLPAAGVAAYLKGEVDTLPGMAEALQPSTVTDATGKENLPVMGSAPAIPPAPTLGQPGTSMPGYSAAYLPPGGKPITFAELLQPVPVASLPAHLSHSQAESVGDCGTKYRLQKVENAVQIPQWALIGGTVFHKVVEDIERWMLIPGAGGLDAPPLALSAWTEAFDAEVQKVEQSSPVPRARWRASKAGAEGETWWRANGPEMVRRYLAARPDQPTLQTRKSPDAELIPGLELEVSAQVQTGYGPVEYKAVIDRVTWDKRRGAYVIKDYKTGAQMPADASQLGEYAQLLRLAGVAFPDAKIYGTYFNARKGTWTPEVELEAAGYTPEWFVYKLTAAQAQKLALAQGPTPARPSSFCGGCSVRYACPIGTLR